MQFSIGDVLALLDKTILNPLVSSILVLCLQAFTSNPLIIRPNTNATSWIAYTIQRPIPIILARSLGLVAFGLVLCWNRWMSRRALNNGVKAVFDWEKEIILVTGAAGGIGATAVKKLLEKGSRVVVLDVLPLTYPKTKRLYYYKCYITNYEAMQAVAADIRRDIDDPTCIVANAGICRGRNILDATKRDIEFDCGNILIIRGTFGVDCLGLLWTAKTFLPAMVSKNHGHFLIIASQTSHLATASIVDYGATKAAALAIYEGLQSEMKHFYSDIIRISCIQLSAVTTKMFTGIKSASNFFLPRLEPEDVGNSIAEALWSGEARNLMIPALAYISPPTRALPEWMRVAMQDGAATVFTELKPHNPMDGKP